jgi:hypothetical protein
MAKKQPKALRFINTLKKGYNALLGKELAGAVNKKAVGLVGAIPSFKKGGKMRKTGLARLHAGEVVLTATQAKSLKKALH